ncbi:uncharacterized protein LOC106757042 [Vigna radiata var. radiata]|uniref:Uncharacterized protein LOC106757042 n=1 Tax=Vigna radiata var. radiata TaxID=3916 RepID=A0A1S3TMW6_VIGRR|nr:uncharacterized protein LOC106757042 [Vigna radiata var. radiata]
MRTTTTEHTAAHTRRTAVRMRHTAAHTKSCTTMLKHKTGRFGREAVDNEGNNALHLVTLLPPEFKSFSGLSARIQMYIELYWFKDAERATPPGLKSMKNKKGKTPTDVFFDEHKQLSKDIKESAKEIADSGMVVATLVATVAFATALTVPESEFVISLHPSLTFGPELLIIFVATMVVAFVAASFLIFDHTTKWVSYVVIPMGVFPLLVFILFQSKFCDDSYWSKYYRPDPKLSSET